MSTQRDDRFYSSVDKSRRGTPVADSQNSLFFQGQGGRTVLPPLNYAFPNSQFSVPPSYTTPYTQPRSSPGRYDYNPAIFSQWPPSSTTPTSQPLNYYDLHDSRYVVHSNYSTYPSRSSPTLPEHNPSSRKLPPLDTTTLYDRDHQRYHSVYAVPGSHVSPIRSPTASYPDTYAPYTNNYGYDVHDEQSNVQPVNSHHNAERSISPYPRASVHGFPTSYSPPPPISPTTSEEPIAAVKKKRKRADAHQLKILTETYNRTAFPSTEERLELAKILDMTPRSVQIWFQNRRQSMRQTRQSSSNAHRSQPLVASQHSPSHEESASSLANYDAPLHGSPFSSNTSSPPLTSAYRRPDSRATESRSRHRPRVY